MDIWVSSLGLSLSNAMNICIQVCVDSPWGCKEWHNLATEQQQWTVCVDLCFHFSQVNI